MKFWIPAIAVGLVVGFAVSAIVLGVGTTHRVCSRGALVGWSGDLATPEAVGLAPPGGYVKFEWQSIIQPLNGPGGGGLGGGPTLLENSTAGYYEVDNWTLYNVDTTYALGWGASPHCANYMMGLGGGNNETIPWGGCAGCPIAPPTPAGVGERLEIPTQVQYGTLNTTILDASYGGTPNGTFSWYVQGGGVVETGLPGLSSLPVTLSSFYSKDTLFGLAITIRQTSESLDIPMHMTRGGVTDIAGSFPADWDLSGGLSVHYWDNNTYVLPLSTDQGSWAIYVPGSGAGIGLNGLLFVQTSGPSS